MANLLDGVKDFLLSLRDRELADLKEMVDALHTRKGKLLAILMISNLAVFKLFGGLLGIVSLLGMLLIFGRLLASLQREEDAKLLATPAVPTTPVEPPAPTTTN